MWCVDLPAQVDALETKAKAAQELLAQYKPAEVPVQPPIEQEQFHEEDGDDHLLEEEEEADEDEDEDEDEENDGDNGNFKEETEETKKEPRILLERTDDVKEALEQAEQDVAGTPPPSSTPSSPLRRACARARAHCSSLLLLLQIS
jgi:hypothetical protein